ncbi:restriction modification system DNA specificity domain protein [Desulfitobacterium hafniense DCB-2]|uniref:Restriction modification system DNA specificity domain protein n=1 Tax=Desulfitobacterium hafniense (strain DSM 10664 / DCB-2) TaxID=272564 RepID=B8FSH8_DESHD|nr:restriction endonuclease subunit S [Desulfitobacterium hafniense]ACL21966.1 restriction modification system DNA specificity domain protein [Desulfitobacterium hafniense DCB-2]
MKDKNTKVPEIRFRGFTDAWEQRELGEDIKFVGGATPFKENPEYWNGDIVWLSSQEIKERFVTSGTYKITKKAVKDNATKVIKAGTPLIVTRSGILAKRFPISIPTVDVAINQDIKALLYDDERIATDFLIAGLQKNEGFILKHIVKTGTTVQSINLPDFQKFLMAYPMLPEQTAIGNFFRTLDDTITLHKRKLDKLKELKKAYLQRMFPQAGNDVPKVRFAGFTEPWASRKLGEVAEIVRGASPRPIQDPKWFDEKSNVGWLRISDVSVQDGRVHYLEQHISKAGQKKTRVLTQPHLLLSIAASVGKPVINYVNTGVHDGFLIFQNPNFEIEFMFQWLKMFEEQWLKYGQPGSQINLNSDIVKNQDISIPTKEEQKHIGNLFLNLDNQVFVRQQKLDQLNQLKRSYLQRMFL